MKASLKTKVQKAVRKIESGDFDELVLDSLFSGLRQYSGKNRVFREIGDFVAHPDERDEGIANNSLEAFYLSFRYFLEYASSKKPLDLSQPMPKYIVKLMKYQIDKCKEKDIKDRFNCTRERLKSRIDTIFTGKKKATTVTVKNEKVLRNNIEAIQYILGFIGSRPAFDQNEILEEIVNVIQSNGLEIDEPAFLKQSKKIILAIVFLMHEAEFDYGAKKPGFCEISSEKTSISYNQQYVDSEGNPVQIEESFGCIQLMGHVVIPKDGADLTVCYPLLVTDIEASDVCHESLHCIEPINEETPNFLMKKLKFDKNILLTSDGMLEAENA